MQLIPETDTLTLTQKLKTAAAILAWSAGLILAGSDGLPFVNLAGAILFAVSCVCLARQTGRPARRLSDTPSPKQAFRKNHRFVPRGRDRLASGANPLRSGGIRPRYARELGVV